MLKIGFIIPRGEHNYKPFRNQPLVALYLLTLLKEKFGEKLSLSLIDLRGISQENILFHIPQNDIFLYSVATPDARGILEVVEDLRHLYPQAKHVAGGPHINIFPDDCAQFFDSIVLGEGERSIVQLVEDMLKADLKRVYRQNGAVNLDDYPYPLRNYLPKAAVVEKGILAGKYVNLTGTAVIFSRGCPFDCYFCANRKLTFGPVRFRSPVNIIEEIEYLKKEYQIEALAIKDDNAIPLNPKIARPFLEAIGKTGVKWRGQSRANGVHPDLVRLAKEAGCTEIAIGIESVSDEQLKLVNKKINLAEAKKYMQFLNKVGIGIRLNLIIGLPGDPEDLVEKTVAFIDETNPSSVLLSLFCPMPGSEIYDYPQRFGIKIDTDNWAKYHTAFARFDAAESPEMVFEYIQETPWGKAKSREKILNDYLELQNVLRQRNLNF